MIVITIVAVASVITILGMAVLVPDYSLAQDQIDCEQWIFQLGDKADSSNESHEQIVVYNQEMREFDKNCINRMYYYVI